MAAGPDKPSLKPLEWISSSRADLTAFPAAVRKEMGHSLHLAQAGEKPPNAKPLRGFGGAGALEVVESYQGNAYRAVYTVKFTQAVYVLHAFQKKSKKGISMPQEEVDTVKQRLRIAAQHYQDSYEREDVR